MCREYGVMLSHLRHSGLFWSLVLIGNPNLSGVHLRMDTKKVCA